MTRILIVDDEPRVREVVRDFLEEAGYHVEEASDGEEGLKRYLDQPADMVVTDILMPKKGGLNFIRELRGIFPEVKIIAMSGGGKDGKLNFLASARTIGAVRTISKPFEYDELPACVRDLLDA
jgi:DNA-binding response OmpR family regulator